jgi:DNA mismatch repair ATPase MutS
MDELFRGTRPEKADLETYECGKRLNGMNLVSFILATHFLNNPVKLEAETNGTCKNYKVDAYAQPDGSIVRPYKLELGITTSNIASEILNAALDGDEVKGN